MQKNWDIVITGLQSWNFKLGSNIANIARTLAKNNRVLFVNYAYDRATLIRQRNEPKVKAFLNAKHKRELQLEKVEENLWVFTPGTTLESINRIDSSLIFDFLNKINGRRFATQINLAIKHLGFSNFILLTDSDFYRSLSLPELIKPSLFLYYIRDNIVATDYYKKQGTRIEAQIIKKANAVITNSESLAEYAREFSPHCYFVGQGCDIALFNHSQVKPLPESVIALKSKFKSIVGYLGVLRSLRIDLNLLIYLAKGLPEIGFLLVGPEDATFLSSKIHLLPNVIFLGPKTESELPSYVNFFDVAINPQVVNEVTLGNYPRKIDEYLIMGKPVVATKTIAMEYFKDYVYLASEEEEFRLMILRALSENSPAVAESRQKYAMTHSWENNIEEIGKVVEICLQRQR